MGNDQTKLKGLEVDRKAIEVTDFWSLYNAEVPISEGVRKLSIFQGEPVVPGQLWANQSPLERSIKNLMIYRHPCILKYVTSWERGSQKHLATERCRPLSLVLQNQSDIQICLGLRNILCSLIFLIEQAKARHLNICISSIYVNADGDWRLGGFEHVWKTKEITKNLLDTSKAYRYKSSISRNELESVGQYLEQYSFGVLCEEILKNRKTSNIPYINEFSDYCITHLKHDNIEMRPKLSAILLHPYFNHEFIIIYIFLMELPLKNPQEKQEFFTSLIDRLRYFDETIVGSQIGNLLLSRMVLLDTTAQLCVTPYVLKTKTDLTSALFSSNTFTKYIIPKIIQIFYVRDAQIRLILLEYFNEYVRLLTIDELKEQILPHLLIGIKDTNDILVAKTLRCLADLVPILGSSIVIGGNRGRLFADGRPQRLPDTQNHWIEPRSITPVMTSGEYIVSGSPIPDIIDISESYITISNNDDNTNNIYMPERLSPDGGEDIRNDGTGGAGTDDEIIEDDAWSDWENNDDNPRQIILNNDDENNSEILNDNTNLMINDLITTISDTNKLIIDDINELDIKNKKFLKTNDTTTEEIDFFKDMEPIIEKSKTLVLTIDEDDDGKIGKTGKTVKNPNKTTEDQIQVDDSRFEIKINNEICESGWDDDDTNGWGGDD